MVKTTESFQAVTEPGDIAKKAILGVLENSGFTSSLVNPLFGGQTYVWFLRLALRVGPVNIDPLLLVAALRGEDEAGELGARRWLRHPGREILELCDVVAAALAGAVEKDHEGILHARLRICRLEEPVGKFHRIGVLRRGDADGTGLVDVGELRGRKRGVGHGRLLLLGDRILAAGGGEEARRQGTGNVIDLTGQGPSLANSAVLADVDAKKVALLRADWTRRDPAVTAALRELGRSGVPLYVIYAPGRAPVLLSEILSVDELRRELAKL
jgi:hypothetical protein